MQCWTNAFLKPHKQSSLLEKWIFVHIIRSQFNATLFALTAIYYKKRGRICWTFQKYSWRVRNATFFWLRPIISASGCDFGWQSGVNLWMCRRNRKYAFDKYASTRQIATSHLQRPFASRLSCRIVAPLPEKNSPQDLKAFKPLCASYSSGLWKI